MLPKIKHLSVRCPTCFAFHFYLYTTKTKNSTMNAKPNLTPEKTCPRDKYQTIGRYKIVKIGLGAGQYIKNH